MRTMVSIATAALLAVPMMNKFSHGQTATGQTAAANAVSNQAATLSNRIQDLEKGGRRAAHAAWQLWQHPDPGAAEALRTRLLTVDQVAGYYAARALGRLRLDAGNVQALAALLPAETNGFWELSAGGVGRLRDAWDAQGRRYSARAPAGMPNLRVAYAAMEALGEIGGDAAAATLGRALTNDQYLIRYGAARGLGRMRLENAKAQLQMAAAADPVLLVRLAAGQALAVIEGKAPATHLLRASVLWPEASAISTAGDASSRAACPVLPRSIAFIKTKHRSDATFGFRDSYFFPKTPRYHSGENLYTLTPPEPGGAIRNLTQLTDGEVQGPEVSFDGNMILFAMRIHKDRDGFHIFEIRADGSGLRQLTFGNCNDADPCYLADGQIAFCSDRAGWQEYYHQERSRVLYVMQANGSDIRPITFNPNQDYEPVALRDGRILYSSYRFYGQDGGEGPMRGEQMSLARIETVLHACNPDGSSDQLLYGSMRGSFYSPMRPMPFSDQFSGWHARGYHVGVSVSLQREMPDGKIICATPAGLTLVDPGLAPLDCEIPIYPEIVNLAGGEEVYIHNYDDMNPIGRFTSPYPAGGNWVWVSHAPWTDLRVNGYGIYLLNLVTRELELIYDDPEMADVDPVPLAPQPRPIIRPGTASNASGTALIFCDSVFNTDQPFAKKSARYIRVLEGVQMGQSINANAAFRTRLLGTAPLDSDGSFCVEVPADVPIHFELLDERGRMLIHETEFIYARPGEIKGCAGCHEDRKKSPPNHRPLALDHPPSPMLRQRGDLIYFGRTDRPYNRIYRP